MFQEQSIMHTDRVQYVIMCTDRVQYIIYTDRVQYICTQTDRVQYTLYADRVRELTHHFCHCKPAGLVLQLKQMLLL